MGKLTISMAIFNSKLLTLPEGSTSTVLIQWVARVVPWSNPSRIPPVPEDLSVDLCVNSASSLPPKEEQSGGGGFFCPDIRNQSVRCLTHAAFLARKYKPCLSRAGDDCGNMQWGLFSFSKCRRILGLAIPSMEHPVCMPSFWSRNAAYFGPCRDWDPVFKKKTTAWCLNAAQKDSPKQLLEFLISPGLKVILGHCLGVEAFWPRIVDFYGMTSLIRGSEVKTSGTTTMQCDTSTSSIIC